ncbi:MAG TPA: hypothetical protein VFC39_19485 [Acidobacteriaceae bacterium]|nr:hypothetical protein [Acidobacteriaceae bacterium]
MRRRMRNRLLAIAMAVGVASCTLAATAQEPGEQVGGRTQFAGMERVVGTVVSVAGDVVTVKAEDGSVYKLATTPNTRLIKGQAPVKVADLKAGDGAMALGNMDAPNKTLHAALVLVTDAATLKEMRENLGKTYISGRVTAIDLDNLKMTLMRPDGVSQTIGFDESTSFKRGGRMGRGGVAAGGAGAAAMAPAEGGESITLADIKVGDNVAGTGSLKGGVFVPGQLNVAEPRAGRGRSGARLGGTVQHPTTPQQ